MIDFGSPFQHAFDHTNRVLFQNFNTGKWFALGFSAWLANFLSSGCGLNYTQKYSPSSTRPGTDDFAKTLTEITDKMLGMGLGFWVIAFCLLALLFCVVVFIMVILGCRGQFMFLDNVIHNRDEIVRPWKEFSREANELTIWHSFLSLFPLLVFFTFFGFALVQFWPDLASHTTRSFTAYLPWILTLFALILLFLPLALLAFFLHEFGVPIMTKHRCSVPQAAGHIWKILRTRFADCLVFMLLRFCMDFAFAILSMMMGCLTCCIGFLPYLSTVVTLPYHVFRQTFVLDCLAQFGAEYNLWPITPPPPVPPTSP